MTNDLQGVNLFLLSIDVLYLVFVIRSDLISVNIERISPVSTMESSVFRLATRKGTTLNSSTISILVRFDGIPQKQQRGGHWSQIWWCVLLSGCPA